MNAEILDRIQNYLGNGVLFNPEMMEHDKVRSLVMDCRKEIEEMASLLSEGMVLMKEHGQCIKELESLLSDAMRVMGLYINVPEFDDLRVRWELLKQKP